MATTTDTDLAAVVVAIRSHSRFVLTTHENPDGDALGSLLALHRALVALGKDSVMFLAGEAPLPGEYRFLDFGELDGRCRTTSRSGSCCSSTARTRAESG